jgi:hypothetical protein
MNRSFPLFLLLIPFLLTACNSEPIEPVNGREVVAVMHDTHADSWYNNLTFVQSTIEYQPGAEPDTTLWWEGIKIPGELRIDIGGPRTGIGMVFRNDSLFMVQNNMVAGSGPTMHPLLILGFDVYGQPVEQTIAKLDTIGFNLDAMHSATWQDRDVWVVGTDEHGDTTAPQFWIDKERLVFVRMTQRVGPELAHLQEVHFDGYERLDDGWIAPEVRFYLDSTLTMVELYDSIQTGVSFPEGFFSPDEYGSTPHWADN